MLTARVLITIAVSSGCSLAPCQAQRTTRGLQVLYDFSSATGALVKDRSGNGQPLNLRIGDPRGVQRSPGTLEIRGSARVQSTEPARQLVRAVQRTGEITVEAWIKPADTGQGGPARIVSLSRNSTNRNITLGQDGDRFEVRFRTNRTSSNGLPSLPTRPRSLTTRLTHVVYTRDRSGTTRLYLNGKQAAAKTVPGSVQPWDAGYHLLLGDEADGKRPWKGTYYLVAIY